MRYTGCKFWNKMLEKIKSNHYLSYNIFVQLVKKYLLRLSELMLFVN